MALNALQIVLTLDTIKNDFKELKSTANSLNAIPIVNQLMQVKKLLKLINSIGAKMDSIL